MSLVGNFTQNYDRTSQQNGTGLARTQSSSSYYQDDVPSSPVREKSKLDTIPQHQAQSYPPSGDNLYPSSEANGDQSSTPMSMTDTLHSRTQNVTSLARQMSRMSERTMTNLFDYQEGSDLDPFSSSFDARKWTRGMVALQNVDTPARQAGLSYKNMSVHGFGSDAGTFHLSNSGCSDRQLTNYQTTRRLYRTCLSPSPVPSRVESQELSERCRS